MLSFFANLPPCQIGMEACGSAHYWARKLAGLGHTVNLMAPQFVKPYVKYPLVAHLLRHPAHQDVVVDPVEEFLQVQINPPRASLRRGRFAPAPRLGAPSAADGIHS